MQFTKIVLGIIFFAYILIILISIVKSKRFLPTLLLTILQGICSLFAVNLLGQHLSIHIPINSFTLGITSIGGISGVIMLLLCDGFLC